MDDHLKILVADDHSLVREGLRLSMGLLAEQVELLEAASADEVRNETAAHPDVDLVILDLHMPGSDGLGLLSELCNTLPDTPIVVLSAEQDTGTMQRCIDRGAAGFIPKSVGSSILVSALQLVLSGGIYIPTTMLQDRRTTASAQLPAAGKDSNARIHAALPAFTGRQTDVLKLLSDGFSNKGIARQLGLSENTVKIHITAILKALGASNRTEAALIYRELLVSAGGNTGKKNND